MGVCRVEGVRLYYQTAGHGDPLVLLHGLGSSSKDWEYQIPAFAKQFRVIAPDFRGFGGSARTGGYGVERFAQDTWEVLDHLRAQRIHLVGYSMGGAVAMQMALDRPERVRRLVLSNTLPSFRTTTLSKRFMLWSRLILMSVFGPRTLAQRMARRLFPNPDQAALREKVARRSAVHNKAVYVETIRALTRWSVSDRLAELRHPVLVLAAEEDYFPAAEVQAFAAALPDARLTIFRGTRHGMPLGAPQAFNRTVLEFLRDGEPGPPPGQRAPASASRRQRSMRSASFENR